MQNHSNAVKVSKDDYELKNKIPICKMQVGISF